MLSASVDRALVQAASEVVVLADHTKLGSDTMFQTVPTELITRLVTDEPPLHDERAAAELQALADQGVEIAVAGPDADASGGDGSPGERRPRREMPLPGQRRTAARNGGPVPQLRSATPLSDQSSGERARVADLRRR
ncbi:DeoR/GlpR transcriptional regulator [Streptomyces californicus]